MDPRVNQEWTSSEIEEARSLIASLISNVDGNYEDGNDDRNKKHNHIVRVLHAWFPWKTVQQVTDLYVDLAVEMHMMKWQRESGANGIHGVVVYPANDITNDNFGMPEEKEAMGNKGQLVFACPSEEMGVMKTDVDTPAVKENKVEMLENQAVHQPAAPHTGRYWTTEEHRLFLRGLRVYGRGDWKNISKYFVTTRTPVQVSSHAQKYFRRLESSASGKHRYSINDVGLHDADPWVTTENSWQARANHDDPTLGQAPATTFATMNNLAQFWTSPFLFCPQANQPAWSGQQMVISAAQMEGEGNFVPDGQQGGYLPAGQWMNNM